MIALRPCNQGEAPVRVLAVRHAPALTAGLCVGDAEVACAMAPEQAAARMLCAAGSASFARVWTSPRGRCLLPARLLAGTLGLPVQDDERLREISLGDWQGRPFAAIAAESPERFGSWLKNWLAEPPPGGESMEDFLHRVASWWRSVPPGDHLLVAHAGVVRALRVLVCGQSWAEAMRAEVPHLQGEWFCARGSAKGQGSSGLDRTAFAFPGTTEEP